MNFLRLLCLFAANSFLFGCAKHETAPDARPQVLRVSQRNEPADLDPATATLPDEFFIVRALSEGLLVPNPDGGAPLPAAAERFEISADGRVYTFHLRDARWSNGEPVTAADFVASYRRVLTPATAAPKADLFFAVKNARAFATGALTDFAQVGFAAPDARTLVVTLAQPNPRFPLYVASGPWIPVNPRIVEKFGRAWTQPANFAGNGPFTLAEWRPQQRVVVKKNPAFRDAASVRLAEIQFLRFDNDDTEERTFRAGQLDVTLTVPFTKLETYAHQHPDELRRTPLAETRFLSFNSQRAPLSDARVRRALALAIDRQKIVERVTRGGQQPAGSFLPPSLASGQNSAPLAFDPAAARTLLADAGFAGGKNFPRLALSAWTPSQTPVLEAIQAMWRQELGIDTAITIREARVHFAALVPGDYDIAFATTTLLLDVADPVALLENFTSTAANNYPHWHSAEFDDALATGDTARAEAVLLAEAPVAPLYFNVHNWLMAQRVRGWQEDALWSRCYLHVYLDEK